MCILYVLSVVSQIEFGEGIVLQKENVKMPEHRLWLGCEDVSVAGQSWLSPHRTPPV